MRLIHQIAFFGIFLNISLASENQSILFVIINQDNEYSARLTQELHIGLRTQSRELKLTDPNIISANEFNISDGWTIAPLIPLVLNKLENQSDPTEWVVFLEDRTSVSLEKLFQILRNYDSKREIWIGRAVHDLDATIIHHFAFHENPTFFKYPNLASGMVFSLAFLKRLKSQLTGAAIKQMDFRIDPSHEFALMVYNNGNGPMIQHEDQFCCEKGTDCATYPRTVEPCGLSDTSSIYFAVKTCSKFHDNRVQVVKKTWFEYTKNTKFFSDVEDDTIPTKSLNIPNTDHGHCEKSIEILKYGLKEFDHNQKLRWLALVDDDTIISPSRTAELISCFQNGSEPLILGERYRFDAQGFNYPTGGAGIILNRAALEILARRCKCSRNDAPDDMILGACAEEYEVKLVHVPEMHQARPEDYTPCRLATKDAVSFHKHWMLDPIKTYRKWFLESDQKLKTLTEPIGKHEL